jgi:DNA-dependent RNA polymerase auxiliary subunit epsilon
MADVITINQSTQIGVESTPGTAVPANKLLESISIEPTIELTQKAFRKQGRRFSSLVVPSKDYTSAKIVGDSQYSEGVYLYSSVMGAATIAAVGASGHSWTWTPPLSGSVVPTTFTVQQGDSVRARQFAYGLVTGITEKFTRDGVTIDGTMLGQQMKDDGTVTMTASPTAVGLEPILGSQWSLFIDSTSAGIGTTQMLRVLEADFMYDSVYGPLWTGNATLASYATHVDLAPKAQMKILLEADAQGMALLANARAGTTLYVQITATGTVFQTSTNYTHQIQFAGQVSGKPSAYEDKEGIYAIEWTLDAIEDTNWGKAIDVSYINMQAAL